MLIIHGRPIKNCLEFYEHFDVSEVLQRPKDFIAFSKGHLAFDEVKKRCIELFEEAACGSIKPCGQSTDFWQGKALNQAPSKRQNAVIDECYFCYKSRGRQDWERDFVMAAAATILADKPFSVPKKAESQMDKHDAIPLDLEQPTVEVTPGRTYRCKFDPSANETDELSLRTVEVLAAPGYSGVAILQFHEKQTLALHSGERAYLNVWKDTVVHVLPNEVEYEHGRLVRDFKRSCIAYNGEKTNIPVNASSFASLGKGKYLYIIEQRLYHIGLPEDEVPFHLYKANTRYVEVAARGSSYYLLTPKGIVRSREGTPDNMRAHFLSLDAALRRATT